METPLTFTTVQFATRCGIPQYRWKEVPNEFYNHAVAELATAGTVVPASVPLLRLGPIQAGGDSPDRSPTDDVRSPRNSPYVLLAPLLLAFDAKCSLSAPEYNSCPTSNDLLRRLVANHAPIPPTYQTIAQNAEDRQNIENAPSISMGPYLLETGQLTGTDSDGVRYCFKLVPPADPGE